MSLTVHLVAWRAGQELGRYEFDSSAQRTIKIGRLNTAQVRLEDQKCARIHSIIEISGNEATLIDMGTSVGTQLNGVKTAKAKLNHNDTLLIGDTSLFVGFNALPSVAPAAPQQAPPAAAYASILPPPAFAGAASKAPSSVAPTAAPLPPTVGVAGPSVGMPRPLAFVATSAATPTPSAAALGFAPEAALNDDNRVLELRLYWGSALLGMYHYVRPKQVTIGENDRTDIFLSSEGLPQEEFPLIRYLNGDYLLSFTDLMEGELKIAGQNYALKQAGAVLGQADASLKDTLCVKMTADTQALLHWGGASFALRFVSPSNLPAAPFGKNIDLQYLNAMLLSFVLHLAMLVTLMVYPRDTEALKVDLFGEPDRFAQLILEAPKENKATQDMLKKMEQQMHDKKEQIEKPPEEVATKTKQSLTSKVDLKSSANKAMPHTQRSAEEKKAEVAKRFSSLLGGKAGGAGNILGGGGGGSLAGTLQNVIGTAGTGSAAGGLAGLGLRGSGPLTGGGLGTSRGIGGIGTSGRLGGGGLNYGANVGLGAAKARKIIDFETPQVEGALSAEVIKRVINQNRNQVRYCYEFQLQRNQNLEGRILITWIIGGNGSVLEAKVKETTMHNAAVENCILSKIRAWIFPQPAGGGTVTVNYPFVFRTS